MAIKLGFALCGSFCTFGKIIPHIEALKNKGYDIVPIMSFNAYNTDTRFGTAESFIKKIEEITHREIIHTITSAEPIGPKKLIDALIIAPCTGNTLAKLAVGIADTPVTLAAKSTLRNANPVIIGISTNDALSGAAKNIGALQNYKNIYFVPYTQDDYINKPTSIVADFDRIEETVEAAMQCRQVQPVILNNA